MALIEFFTAEFITDGTDGKLYYDISDPADLNIKGDWRIWGYTESPTGVIAGKTHTMKVFEKGDIPTDSNIQFIHVGQTDLRLTAVVTDLDGNPVDISAATVKKLEYIKPT